MYSRQTLPLSRPQIISNGSIPTHSARSKSTSMPGTLVPSGSGPHIQVELYRARKPSKSLKSRMSLHASANRMLRRAFANGEALNFASSCLCFSSRSALHCSRSMRCLTLPHTRSQLAASEHSWQQPSQCPSLTHAARLSAPVQGSMQGDASGQVSGVKSNSAALRCALIFLASKFQ